MQVVKSLQCNMALSGGSEKMASGQQVIAKVAGDVNQLHTGEDNGVSIMCCHCGRRPAEIFQVTGDYCVECWQEVTHSMV